MVLTVILHTNLTAIGFAMNSHFDVFIACIEKSGDGQLVNGTSIICCLKKIILSSLQSTKT